MRAPTSSRIIRAVGFVAFMLAIHVALRHVYLSYVMPSPRPFAPDRALYGHMDNVDMLILGNSHPLWGLDTTIIGHSFNLATLDEG